MPSSTTTKRRGGAAPYRKGAEHERRAKKAYEAQGFIVVRSPQSGSAMDLTCMRRNPSYGYTSTVDLVQVKSEGYLRPAERDKLVEVAKKAGAHPILAWIERGVLHRRDLETGDALEEFKAAR